MMQVDLSVSDRARIDALTTELAKYNRSNEKVILVGCSEAARLLQKTPATISTMLRDGRLKKLTIGRSTGIPLADVERLAGMR